MTHQHQATALRAAEATDRAELDEAKALWAKAADQAKSLAEAQWAEALEAESEGRFALGAVLRTWAEQTEAEAEALSANAG